VKTAVPVSLKLFIDSVLSLLSLTAMEGATLSTPPSTGLSGIQFSSLPN